MEVESNNERKVLGIGGIEISPLEKKIKQNRELRKVYNDIKDEDRVKLVVKENSPRKTVYIKSNGRVFDLINSL